MITSTTNAQVKNVIALRDKAKARKEQDCFLVEGIRMFLEIPKEEMVKAYCSKSFYDYISGSKPDETNYTQALQSRIGQCEVVEDKVFQIMSDTVTPQGVLAIVKKRHLTLNEVLSRKHTRESHCFLILESLQDPGNLGTIVRTAEGAGAAGIIMNNGTVDIYNPKVVRSTMGSVFRVPFVYVDDLMGAILSMKENGIQICAAHLKGTMDYDEPDYTKRVAFMIGNEGNGLSDAVSGQADLLIKIPMCGKVESLNAASAANVLMYESFRQNRRNL